VPLFCVHAGGGFGWSYSALLRHIDQDVPIYLLQARGLARPEPLPDSIEEMVTDYIAHIRTVRPVGPYRLLGWSFGGNLAHAIATELQRQGAEVDLLVMLDAFPSLEYLEGLRVPDEQDILRGLLQMYARKHLTGIDVDEIIDFVRFREILGESGSMLASLDEYQVTAIREVLVNNGRIMADYRYQRFDGDLMIIVATEDRPANPPSPADWQPYVSGAIETHEIACPHQLLTEPGPMAIIGPLLAAAMRQDSDQHHRTA
jgi:thioesterase domain-containing protein